MALNVISIITAAWVIFNIVFMIYIFFHFMVKLRIYGKLILQFYALALIVMFFKLWQCYSRIFCNSYNYRQDFNRPKTINSPLNISRSIVRIGTIAIGFLQIAMMYKIVVSVQHLKEELTL